MNAVLLIGVGLFVATFSLLIWETNTDHEKAMARRRHPTRSR